jgi:hypothetical protein
MFFFVFLCCPVCVEAFATGFSFVRRSPTACLIRSCRRQGETTALKILRCTPSFSSSWELLQTNPRADDLKSRENTVPILEPLRLSNVGKRAVSSFKWKNDLYLYAYKKQYLGESQQNISNEYSFLFGELISHDCVGNTPHRVRKYILNLPPPPL